MKNFISSNERKLCLKICSKIKINYYRGIGIDMNVNVDELKSYVQQFISKGN